MSQVPKAKKLATISITSVLITASTKFLPLQQILCIEYSVQFGNNLEVQALIDFRNEVNVMTSANVAKLGLVTQKTNIRAQIINNLVIETYEMVITGFSV